VAKDSDTGVKGVGVQTVSMTHCVWEVCFFLLHAFTCLSAAYMLHFFKTFWQISLLLTMSTGQAIFSNSVKQVKRLIWISIND
jgi:hypothetical protein